MQTRKTLRKSRQHRIRAVVRGTASRPRLAVYRSGSALFVQIIDDDAGKTLVSLRSIGKNTATAAGLGNDMAKLASKHKISLVVLDRGGNRYHGVIKAFADAAREGGLKF